VRELVDVARARGVETHVLEKDENGAALARKAAEADAPALGMAGGDGSLGAVAGVAVDHGIPFVCVPFGSRNHFARDLGLDYEDPVGGLAAFEGEERAVDVGRVDGLVFLNNVSLGLYASLVHDPGHETKNRIAAGLRMVPAAFGRARRPLELVLDAPDSRERVKTFVLLVANNDYALDAISDLGARTRLDEGLLHVYVVKAVGRFRLALLFARALAGRVGKIEGYSELTAERLTVDSPRPRIHVAVDGEPAVLPAPLEFELLPRALRVLVPSVRREARPDR
jgi:diacylglycerol kinase family enzyme